MNFLTTKRIVIGSSLAVALALAILVPVHALAGSKDAKKMSATEMNEHCQTIMKDRAKLAADIKADDADLTAQITRMNSAPEDKKLDLMAAAVTKFVEQRSAMNVRRETMQTAMVTHMAEHNAMGHESMGKCPMMGMNGE